MFRMLILATLLACSASHAAEPLGTLTILEGDAVVYRGPSRLQAVEGARIDPGDIVETRADGFVQIELADQGLAQLGPQTRALFGPSVPRGSDRSMYLLSGWAKLARPAGVGPFELRTPAVELSPVDAVAVVHATPQGLTVFAERGALKVNERGPASAAAPLALKANDMYRRKAGSAGVLNPPGEMKAMVQAMPAGFRDTLPLRAQRFRDKPAALRPSSDFAYPDVEDWLQAEPPVRKALMQRWRGKARDPAFRSALVAHLDQHPEWDRILFPEKYLPRSASASRDARAAAR